MSQVESPTRSPRLVAYSVGESPVELDADEVRVYVVDLGAGVEGDRFAELAEWEWLSDAERARAERLVRPRDGRRFVRCRGALRVILGRLLDAPAGSVAFQTGPGGKPILPFAGDSPDRRPLHFNVSHSGELALIAVSRRFELGVDVEKTRPISQAERIVESYFTEAERAEFLAVAEADRPAAFIRGWTRKEAILKAQGVGLAGLATSFETRFGTGVEPEGEFVRCVPHPTVLGWALWEVVPRPGYVAALAVAGG